MVFLAGCSVPLPDDLAARAPGTLDLRQVDFSAGDVYVLPTSWQFYWRRFLTAADLGSAKTPPDALLRGMQPWTGLNLRGRELPADGYATYRMRLLLPHDGDYALRMAHQLTAVSVFVNGQERARVGSPGTDLASSVPGRGVRTIAFQAKNGEAEIILHVANFHTFRGGLRHSLELGERATVERYGFRSIAIEWVLLGFFLAVVLYHLAFFFTQARELSFLYFGLFCLTFAIRVPFLGENTIDILVGELSWEFEARLLESLNLMAPPMLMLFLRSLFPDVVSRRVVWVYSLASFAFMCTHFFGMKVLARAMFLMYVVVLVPLLSHAVLITLRMALHGRRSAILMTGGMLCFCALCFWAMYRNWMAAPAADVALLGFAIFALFQSVALGQAYRDSFRERELLTARLNRSRAALTAQRKELEINLHDTVGGALTDLKILTERGIERARSDPGFEPAAHFTDMRERLDQTNLAFRGQLLFMEDLELTGTDPLTGLQLMLLRRYSDAGRELVFQVDEDCSLALQKAMSDDAWRFEFLQLAREICTNDLKYGEGESSWRLAFADVSRSKRSLAPFLLLQRNRIATQAPTPAETQEPVVRRAAQRAARLGGELVAERTSEEHALRVVLRPPKLH